MYIEGTTIDDTWRSMMAACVQYGIDYEVKRGSYEGQLRKQFSNVMMKIRTPWVRPLAPILPPSLPGPTTDEAIQEYFVEYLMGDIVKPNEDYTYGSFIVPQISRAIDILNQSKGGTNQACITVGDRNSINLADPPWSQGNRLRRDQGAARHVGIFQELGRLRRLPPEYRRPSAIERVCPGAADFRMRRRRDLLLQQRTPPV